MIGSWSAPRDHGPSLRMVAAAALLSVALLVGWGALAAGVLERGASGKPVRTTINLSDDGRLDGTPMRVWGASDGRSGGDARPGAAAGAFAAGTVELRGRRDGIRIAAGAGIDEQTISMRVEASCAVAVRHPDDAAPSAKLGGEECSRQRVTIVVPASQLDTSGLKRGGDDIHDLTAPIDRRIAEQRADAELFDALHDHVWWLVILGALAAILPTALAWWVLARRFFVPPNFQLQAGSKAVPEVVPATIGAMRTLGTEELEAGRAFVTTVLDLIARGVLRARRAEVGPRAFGVLIGRPASEEEPEPSPAARRAAAAEAGYPVQYDDEDSESDGASTVREDEAATAAATAAAAGRVRAGSRRTIRGLLEHEQAAIDLLEAWDDAADDDDTASTWVPDSVQRLEQRLASGSVPGAANAQLAHQLALENVAAAHAWRQRAPWQVLAAIAVAGGACVATGLLIALLGEGRGEVARAWLLAATGLPACAGALAALRDVRRWRRVDPARAGARARWLAWRGVLASSESIDDRSLALAVGTSLHPDLPRAVSPVGTIGIDAITVRTAQALAFMAGSVWDVPLTGLRTPPAAAAAAKAAALPRAASAPDSAPEP